MSVFSAPVAVLYQAQAPPIIDGIRKPMKPGGYADSGADLAYVLSQQGQPVVTPVTAPSVVQYLAGQEITITVMQKLAPS